MANEGKFGLVMIIMGVVTILVGVICFPLVNDTVADTLDGANASDASDDLTGSSATILNAIPVFYLLGVLIGGIAMMIIPVVASVKA